VPLTTINLPEWYEQAATTPRLDDIAAPLRYRVGLILQAMAILNIRMFVASGLRSDKEQMALFAQGRTVPGQVVTQLDGVTKRSNHQRKLSGPYAGFGTAVDMAFIDADGKASWAETMPWTLYGRMATSLGLTWGGDWVSFKDKPHIELKG
jgi:peptidoglycan L-alanyl-D-glutamate endopeptidase CwlK